MTRRDFLMFLSPLHFLKAEMKAAYMHSMLMSQPRCLYYAWRQRAETLLHQGRLQMLVYFGEIRCAMNSENFSTDAEWY